jgi:hypothetical protein
MITTGSVAINLAQVQVDLMVGRAADSAVTTLMASIVTTCNSLTGGAQPVAGLAQRVIDVLNPAVTAYLASSSTDPSELLDLFAVETIGWYTIKYNNGIPNGLITVLGLGPQSGPPHFAISV